ncbi:hypothetical protein KW801_04020, partial [Candidatus Saccharibacteria bacterium]|nr:hypothetical protein [Candidatus Saccharibacteria bacterium]
MQTAKRFVLSLSTLLLVSGVALAIPASANDGTSGHASAEAGTTGGETETEVETHAGTLKEQFRLNAQADLAASL